MKYIAFIVALLLGANAALAAPPTPTANERLMPVFNSEQANSLIREFSTDNKAGVTFKGATGTPQAGVTPGTGIFSGKGIVLSGDASFSGMAAPKFAAATVLTPVALATATPASAGNALISGRFSIVPTPVATAANWVVLPDSATYVGQLPFTVYNQSAVTVPLAPRGTDVINAAAAATPYACATTKLCECLSISSGQWVCTSK